MFIFSVIPASTPDVQVQKTHSKNSGLLYDEFYVIYKSQLSRSKSVESITDRSRQYF